MENEKKDSALVRSSAAEYLTFVASTGEDKDSIEMHLADAKDDGDPLRCGASDYQ